MHSRPNGTVGFRPATAADSGQIREWRNEVSAREASFNSDLIPSDMHGAWFARALAGAGPKLYVAVDAAGRDIGYVRFDVNGDTADISVCVDPSCRDRGIGRAVIRGGAQLVMRELGVRRVVAYIKDGNDRSLAAFKAAGFTVRGREARGGAGAWVLDFAGLDAESGAPRVLFRADAGPSIGLGHLQRCFALAAAFADAGRGVRFVVNDNPSVHDRVADGGWAALPLTGIASWSDDDAQAVVNAAAGADAIVVVDSDLEPPAYIRRLRASGLLVVAVEDEPVADIAADVLLNGDAHGGLVGYAAPPETTLLLGPSFAPLPRPYWQPDVPAARVPPLRALVTLGGADPHGLTAPLLDAAGALLPSMLFEVVAGPYAGNRAAIDAAVSRLGARAVLHVAPRSMFTLIAACDVALTAAGQTLYELAALGRPAVAIQVAGNQRPQLAAFERAGVVVDAGMATDPGIAGRAAARLADLVTEPSRLAAMAAAGPNLVDGQGAHRVVDAVLSRAWPAPPGRALTCGPAANGGRS